MIISTPPVAHVAATKQVEVRDDFFKAKSLTVAKGTKVKWTWKGSSQHNVTVSKGPVTFRSPLQRSGTYTKKLTKKGTYTLLCTIHAPDMRMTIKVK